MQDIVNKIHKLLIKSNKKIAVAESCTGGLLSKLLTDLSGSSNYFILGIVAYSNQAKVINLGVPSNLINNKGAVSKEVASKMALEVRKHARTDIGIAITGIAGPTGGTPQKPVGTVFIALDSKKKKICRRFNFRGSRNIVRKNAALKAIEILIALLNS